jgi:putative transposase
LLTVCRYVERNPLRAGLVPRAETWRWSSLWHREKGSGLTLLSAWPVARPAEWVGYVNQGETAGQLEAVRRSVVRGMPFGHPPWQERTAAQLGLEATLRPRGRPRRDGTQGKE